MNEFERNRQSVLTTFYMPLWETTGANINVKREFRLPYHAIRIIEPFTIVPTREYALKISAANGCPPFFDPLCGTMEAIFISRDEGIETYEKSVFTSPKIAAGSVFYDPSLEATHGRRQFQQATGITFAPDAWYALARFLDYLENRGTRYVEQATTRQMRRSLGVESDYREYIVVPREESPRYANAMRKTDLHKRLLALHTVRGHMRHLPNGKLIPVRPHTRGNLGTAVQVKDYHIQG